MKYNSVVVGGGIAGLTSAAYIAKAGRSVAMFPRQKGIINCIKQRY